ncbi:MAG TPA: TetR/AcrR family transcriptional regulator [Chthonomonadales bacterium]|nr:TetR/AcrR family transcriptional regulator [Chthonomonadales bacterium]
MTDRRAERTREALRKAFIELVSERGYDATTIQLLADRANVARTTFYLHYQSKQELFMDCHDNIVCRLPRTSISQTLLSGSPPPGMVAAFEHLAAAGDLIRAILRSKEGALIVRMLHDWKRRTIEAQLQAALAEESAVPVDLLANYLAGAHMGLTREWLEKRVKATPVQMARTLHRLHRAAIDDSLPSRQS